MNSAPPVLPRRLMRETREGNDKRGTRRGSWAKSISARGVECNRGIPQCSSFLPLSREGWASYSLIGREIISDAIRARTQPRCRVITVKATLPSTAPISRPSSTCRTTVSPFRYPALSLNRRNHRAPNHYVYYAVELLSILRIPIGDAFEMHSGWLKWLLSCNIKGIVITFSGTFAVTVKNLLTVCDLKWYVKGTDDWLDF